MNAQRRRAAGFTLLPVILVMTLIAGVAYLLNRDNGMNAAMVASQGDQDRARYAAEAGLQAVNADIQTRNCTGFYPSFLSQKTNSNFGGASYAAYAIVPLGNVVSLVATGTYNGTSVTLTRANVIAYQLAPQSYTLQPNGTAMQDSYIASNPIQNHGNDATLMLKWSGWSSALLQFDFSMFPAGSLPLAATLSLYTLSTTNWGDKNAVYRMSQSWAEGNGSTGVNWTTRDGTLPWTTAGGDRHPVPVTTSVPVVAGIWQAFDITQLATGWMLGRYPNLGMMVSSPGGNDPNTSYASSDSTTSAQRPKIAFSYLLPCGTTPPSAAPSPPQVITLSPVADAGLDQSQFKFNYGASTTIVMTSPVGKVVTMITRFDVSTLPPGTEIVSAKLRQMASKVFKRENSPKLISAYALSESWSEGSATGVFASDGASYETRDAIVPWTTLGGTYGATPISAATDESSGISPPPSNFNGGWVSWDLTALVQEWVDGVRPNYGVILVPSGQLKESIDFETREAAADRPQLVITYR